MEIKELYRLYQQHPCITTDSRDCPQGSIFIALKGDNFDGNKFALSALENGCDYAIVDDPDLFTVYSLQMITLTDQMAPPASRLENPTPSGLPANQLYARLCRLLPKGRKNLNRQL